MTAVTQLRPNSAASGGHLQILERHMYDAECALHLARQARIDAWVAAAYEVLHTAIAARAVALNAMAA